MTSGPAAGEPGPGTEARERTPRERDPVGAVLPVLALGLAVRLIIAYLLPGSGFRVDLQSFSSWAENLASEGLYGFYDRPFFHDYTPGYLYVLWLVGEIGQWLGRIGVETVGPWMFTDLLKLPPILADLALGWLVWSMTRELGAGRRAARLAALLVVLNPVSWFDSVVWGQVDSFGVVFLLLGIRELWRDRPERAAVLTVIAAIIKPQLGILVPIVAAVTIRRALLPAGGYGDDGGRPAGRWDLPWERTSRGQVRIWTTGIAGLLTAIALSLPFGLSLPGLIGQIFSTAGGYPYLSVNAYNPWALLSLDGSGIAADSRWVRDAPGAPGEPFAAFGPVPAVAVGTLLLLITFVVVTLRVAQRPDRRTILVGVAVLAVAFFVVPTRVHERYLYPFFAVAAPLAAVSWRWRLAWLAAAAAVLANMYVVLTTLYPDNPGVADWLGIGPAIRSETGVTIVALTLLGVFLVTLSEIREGGLARLAAELRARRPRSDRASATVAETTNVAETARARTGMGDDHRRLPAAEPSPPDSASVPRPSEGVHGGIASPRADRGGAWPMARWRERPTVVDAGYGGWLRSRLFERPIRPDRSRLLHGEGGGRLDRLDLWLVLVLLASVLTLRIWRLAEPYQMHFDEVYHARTAAEFLQDWRYGISHDIYEWTHPHLAKYAMAGGIVAWGDDRVTAESQLGVPVRSVAIEPRWDEAPTAATRSGDRVYVATGSDIRVYDLATRVLVASVSLPGAAALAVDEGRHQLWIGTETGELLTADTTILDAQRRDGPAGSPAQLELVARGHADGSFQALFAASDGVAVVGVLDGDRVATFDADDGHQVGLVEVPDAGQMASAGSADAVVITPSDVADPGAEAVLLAGIVGGGPGDIEAEMRAGEPYVFLQRTPTGDARSVLDTAIREGQLPGVEVRLVRRIAVAGRDGVTFLDAESGAVTSTLDVGGPAAGLALITGVDTDRLYVSVDASQGPVLVTVEVAGDQARDGPYRAGQLRLPGQGGRVLYDRASQMVHVEGMTPAGDGRTVYVVEPHGNAVYADARLPFEAVALVLDATERYPSSDREQLLAFAADGTVGSIDVGEHAFAWRLPGVIAGALLAVLLYLLARILFRRRAVAIIAGVLVLADGMLFAQSRIGMNDSYVGLFIVAAYLLFAALWTGAWRGWAPFWLGMPAVGLLLGLALASKWVAAYSIGALGILVLTRSALGRLLLIAGMIVASTLLGYLAILTPTGSESGGNVLFLLLMVGLTGIAVVTTVLHPIAWTWEEQRLAVGAPGAIGAVVVLAGLALGVASRSFSVGPLAATPMEVGFALILLSALIYGGFVLAGRRGFGPMAASRPDDDPRRRLEPAAPAPGGWLRPGALAGLPMAWVLGCLIAIPVVVYVVSYLPWAFIENHQLWPGFPAGHTGQTLVDLTGQMYAYHNNLTAAHPASSPWWAWPFDLKPVWFYQESFAGGTAASIYDAGNLVAWWLAVPAMGFVAWQAFRRRSLALALIAIGFACQWIAWARIDRAAFQYHYYTSLPFLLLGLAYFLGELWHGASRRTWLLARLAAAAVVIGPMALWLFERPLCTFVRVNDVYPNSPSCPTLVPELVLSGRALALGAVVGLGVLALLRQLSTLTRGDASVGGPPGRLGPLVHLALTAALTMAGQLIVGRLVPETPLVTLRGLPVEPLALLLLLPLLALAAVVATARDARRFVVGCLLAISGWFVLWYPNLAALPLPAAMVNTYQGLLPTYVYSFQFPVSTIDRSSAGQGLLSTSSALLLGAILLTCLVLAYSAWSWRMALAEGGGIRSRLRFGPWRGLGPDGGSSGPG